MRQELKFESENQFKLEEKRSELEKEHSKMIDDANEIRKALPEK